MSRYSFEQAQGYLVRKLQAQKLFYGEEFPDGVRIFLTNGPAVGSVTINANWLDSEDEAQFLEILDSALREALSAATGESILKSKGRDAKKVSV